MLAHAQELGTRNSNGAPFDTDTDDPLRTPEPSKTCL
jgi:hypothetical protein